MADRGDQPAGIIYGRLAMRQRADTSSQAAAQLPIGLTIVPKPDRTAQRVGKQSVVGRRHTLATPETGSEA